MKGAGIYIDNSIIEQARNIDMIDFLKKRYGFTFSNQGGTYRCHQRQSLIVKDDRRSWYWHSYGIGGYGAIDFLVIAECLPFRDAMKELAGIAPAKEQPRQETAPPKALILPEKAGVPLRLYGYLCNKRGIDAEIVNTLLQEGKIYEDKRGNVVFVGFDERGQARFASLRGTYGDSKFRMDCPGSDKRYGFHMTYANTDTLYVFESAIDAMSHASLESSLTSRNDTWRDRNRLSLGGTSDTALSKYLEAYPSTYELILCLDNDPPGRAAASAITKRYRDLGYKSRISSPRGKDVNDDLLTLRAAEKSYIKEDPCL